jgi:FlaG protein
MSEGAIGPIGDVNALRGAELVRVGHLGHDGGRPAPEHPVPGVQEFDRAEVLTRSGLAQSYAKFVAHPDTGMVSIKILDARTDTVIREIPSDDVLKIVEELQSYLKLRTAKRG